MDAETDVAARYARDGYLVPDWRVPDDLLADMRAALDRLIAENPHVRPEHLVLRWGGGAEALPAHMRFLDFVRTPALLDLVEALFGPDLVCWGAHVFCKPAATGLTVPWHQDAPYWPIRPMAACTVWIALDRSDTGNGCLRVLRGSHRAGIALEHVRDDRPDLALNLAIDEATLDPTDMVDVELEAGQMSIHDAWTVHGSRANTSDRRRTGLAIRYMPATSLYDRTIARAGGAGAIRQDMSKRPIYLVRGHDRAGNDFAAGQDRPFPVGGDG